MPGLPARQHGSRICGPVVQPEGPRQIEGVQVPFGARAPGHAANGHDGVPVLVMRGRSQTAPILAA